MINHEAADGVAVRPNCVRWWPGERLRDCVDLLDAAEGGCDEKSAPGWVKQSLERPRSDPVDHEQLPERDGINDGYSPAIGAGARRHDVQKAVVPHDRETRSWGGEEDRIDDSPRDRVHDDDESRTGEASVLDHEDTLC